MKKEKDSLVPFSMQVEQYHDEGHSTSCGLEK